MYRLSYSYATIVAYLLNTCALYLAAITSG